MEKNSGRHKRAVVVFDSGIGGLNLLYECAKRMPRARYFYASDNDNVPYGNRSAEEILSLTLKTLEGIERLNPALLAVACNTVTARCIESLRQRFSFPVVGIQPAVKQAEEVGGRCLVLATEATVNSQAFKNLLKKFAPEEAVTVACHGLADYIEKNIFSLPERLPDGLLPEIKVDSVVLGCTHYAFVKRQIERLYHCPVFDGMAGTADHCAKICGTSDHLSPFTGKTDHLCYNKLQITYLAGNRAKNEQILKYLFANKFN